MNENIPRFNTNEMYRLALVELLIIRKQAELIVMNTLDDNVTVNGTENQGIISLYWSFRSDNFVFNFTMFVSSNLFANCE